MFAMPTHSLEGVKHRLLIRAQRGVEVADRVGTLLVTLVAAGLTFSLQIQPLSCRHRGKFTPLVTGVALIAVLVLRSILGRDESGQGWFLFSPNVEDCSQVLVAHLLMLLAPNVPVAQRRNICTCRLGLQRSVGGPHRRGQRCGG